MSVFFTNLEKKPRSNGMRADILESDVKASIGHLSN